MKLASIQNLGGPEKKGDQIVFGRFPKLISSFHRAESRSRLGGQSLFCHLLTSVIVFPLPQLSCMSIDDCFLLVLFTCSQTARLIVLLFVVILSPVPLQLSLSSTFWNFLHAHSTGPACLSSTFFYHPLNRKGKYKPASQPKLKWAEFAEEDKNKRWFVELIDSWHFIKAPISTT